MSEQPPLQPPEGPRAELALLARHITKAHSLPRMELMMIDQRMAIALMHLHDEKLNRPHGPTKVLKLWQAMEEGRWRLTHQGIMIDTNGRLRDGQHRLRALIKHGKPLQFWVCFGCDPTAFDVVDQGDKRTASNVLSIDGYEKTSTLAATVGLLIRVERQSSLSPDSAYILSVTRERMAQGDELALAITAGKALHRKIKSARPAAMALAHYWIRGRTGRPDRLSEFWESLTTGADLGLRDARLLLRDILLHPEKMAPELRGGSNSYVFPVRQAGAVILTWNGWAKGKRVGAKTMTWNPKKPELPEDVV